MYCYVYMRLLTSTKEPGAIESTNVNIAAPDRDIAVSKEVDCTETKYVSEEVPSLVERSCCCESVILRGAPYRSQWKCIRAQLKRGTRLCRDVLASRRDMVEWSDTAKIRG